MKKEPNTPEHPDNRPDYNDINNRVTDQNDGGKNRMGSFRRRFDYFLSRADSLKWLLRGLLFVPIVMVVDHFYRQQRDTGSLNETMLKVFMIISIIGLLQFPIGLYGVIKHWIRGKEEGNDPPED